AIGLAREDIYAAISVIKVRNGRIVGQSPFHLERTGEVTIPELLEDFIARHYTSVDHFPNEIIIPEELYDKEMVENFLKGISGHKVEIVVPRRGHKKDLLETAQANAEHLLNERRLMAEKRDMIPRAVKALQEVLHLSSPPRHIEAYDVSHIMGRDSVASMIVFKDGKPSKSHYRIYNIKSVHGVDDFAALEEVLERRFKRLKKEINMQQEILSGSDYETDEEDGFEDEENETNKEFQTSQKEGLYPDLILIDGGIGQLNRAKEVLEKWDLGDIPVIGLAKRLEEIYVPGDPLPINLPKTSSALKLLQQVRDEAHRFAISRHRKLRAERQVKSRLDEIKGVGPLRRQRLLQHFGSVARIARADVKEIAQLPGFNLAVARKIKDTLGGE
ncbi:MAG: excinuclease ABC subunit UvrC, partial [bacterium]